MVMNLDKILTVETFSGSFLEVLLCLFGIIYGCVANASVLPICKFSSPHLSFLLGGSTGHFDNDNCVNISDLSLICFHITLISDCLHNVFNFSQVFTNISSYIHIPPPFSAMTANLLSSP